jgi:hypothetical protein
MQYGFKTILVRWEATQVLHLVTVTEKSDLYRPSQFCVAFYKTFIRK